MCFNTVCENNSQMEYFRKALKTAGDSYILLFTRHHPFGGFLLCDNSSIHHFREDVLLFTMKHSLLWNRYLGITPPYPQKQMFAGSG